MKKIMLVFGTRHIQDRHIIQVQFLIPDFTMEHIDRGCPEELRDEQVDR